MHNTIKLTYGISNYKRIATQGYYYVDKTPFIHKLENPNEPYVFFLRPRRFGKSLTVSLLNYYYGIEYKKEFQELFGNYFIGKNPTQRSNSYYVLNFDFSRIDTKYPVSTFEGFLMNVKTGLKVFNSRYKLLDKSDIEKVLSLKSPNFMLIEFFALYKQYHNEKKIYLIIDEYDHFANELIAFQLDEFSKIVSKNGFVRKFYEAIKTATFEGIVDRLFATGIMPITLDSLTSGFNIARNVTLDKEYNEIMGFTEKEISDLIEEICKSCPECDKNKIIQDMRDWYNGYLFHKDTQEKVYNPDMVLYFANYLIKDKNCTYPERMLDANIASDYGKVRNLISVKDRKQNIRILEEFLEKKEVYSLITVQYSFEKEFEIKDFISLLFYSGLITINGSRGPQYRFTIPNYVIKLLYWDFFGHIIRSNLSIEINTYDLENALYELAYDNKINRFISYIEATLKNLSNRDYIKFDEKYIKLLFIVYASIAHLYFIKSEYETEKNYPDIMFLFRKPFRPEYQFIFEIKYLKKSDSVSLEAKKQEALQQIKKYLESEEIKSLESLKAYMIVFVGDRAEVVEEVK